jgi:hypothetical protein
MENIESPPFSLRGRRARPGRGLKSALRKLFKDSSEVIETKHQANKNLAAKRLSTHGLAVVCGLV